MVNAKSRPNLPFEKLTNLSAKIIKKMSLKTKSSFLVIVLFAFTENNVNIEELKSANIQLAAESEAATRKLEEVLREVDSLRSRGSLSAAEESAIEGDASSAWKPEYVQYR